MREEGCQAARRRFTLTNPRLARLSSVRPERLTGLLLSPPALRRFGPAVCQQLSPPSSRRCTIVIARPGCWPIGRRCDAPPSGKQERKRILRGELVLLLSLCVCESSSQPPQQPSPLRTAGLKEKKKGSLRFARGCCFFPHRAGVFGLWGTLFLSLERLAISSGRRVLRGKTFTTPRTHALLLSRGYLALSRLDALTTTFRQRTTTTTTNGRCPAPPREARQTMLYERRM